MNELSCPVLSKDTHIHGTLFVYLFKKSSSVIAVYRKESVLHSQDRAIPARAPPLLQIVKHVPLYRAHLSVRFLDFNSAKDCYFLPNHTRSNSNCTETK